MTSLYTVSRQDLYDYRRCPKIVAIKADRAIRQFRKKSFPLPQAPRVLEPAIVGKIGELAVKTVFSGKLERAALRDIRQQVPQMNLNEQLGRVALESLRGAAQIRSRLSRRFGELKIVGRGTGRHPDLAATVRPDFIVETSAGSNIIAESKDTLSEAPADRFQAMFYNGIAADIGIYVLEERIENGSRAFSPTPFRGRAQTILIYPRLAKFELVEECFTPDFETTRDVWRVKELGFAGKVPEADCGPKCPHRRLKANLPTGDLEPAPPIPLLFASGIVESDFNLDLAYQVDYAWNLLPHAVKLMIFSGWRRRAEREVVEDWIVRVAGVGREASQLVVHPERFVQFHESKPTASQIMKRMGSEIESWRKLLGPRLADAGPSILGRANAVYSLPEASKEFVKMSRAKWI